MKPGEGGKQFSVYLDAESVNGPDELGPPPPSVWFSFLSAISVFFLAFKFLRPSRFITEPSPKVPPPHQIVSWSIHHLLSSCLIGAWPGEAPVTGGGANERGMGGSQRKSPD